MKADTTTARGIAEDLLQRIGRALMDRNFGLFQSCFLLPQVMESFSGRREVETTDDLKAVFMGVCAHLDNLDVKTPQRRCIVAEFQDTETAHSTDESRLISGSELVQRAYRVFSILRHVDGTWFVWHSKYAVADLLEHAIVFGGTGDHHRSEITSLHESVDDPPK